MSLIRNINNSYFIFPTKKVIPNDKSQPSKPSENMSPNLFFSLLLLQLWLSFNSPFIMLYFCMEILLIRLLFLHFQFIFLLIFLVILLKLLLFFLTFWWICFVTTFHFQFAKCCYLDFYRCGFNSDGLPSSSSFLFFS